MAEPTTSTASIIVAGAGLAGVMSGINADAAVGALCGALVFFATTQELPVARRLMFLVISFVAGYMFAPLVAVTKITIPLLGTIGPMNLPGPAAFISSALVITVTLAAIKQRRGTEPTHG